MPCHALPCPSIQSQVFDFVEITRSWNTRIPGFSFSSSSMKGTFSYLGVSNATVQPFRVYYRTTYNNKKPMLKMDRNRGPPAFVFLRTLLPSLASAFSQTTLKPKILLPLPCPFQHPTEPLCACHNGTEQQKARRFQHRRFTGRI